MATDTGITGWGEASPWPVFTGTPEGNASALKNYLVPMITERNPFDVEVILAEADKIVVHCSEAKAALENALLDIMGKALGLPIYSLLGDVTGIKCG